MKERKPEFSTLPLSLQDLLKTFQRENIKALLVGGLVRDFYLTGQWSSDVDLEVRCNDLELQKFLRNNSKATNVEVLRFGVCRLHWDSMPLEIAPARKEIYPTGQTSFGHCDFEVEYFDRQISEEEAFCRRDFTINAMGLILDEHNQFQLVDPYGGLDHLERGILEAVHPEFHRDPVRLARAVRFSLKFSLEYSSKLIELFTRMSLEKISMKLILREAQKYGQLNFFKELFILIEDCGVSHNEEFRTLAFLRDFQSKKSFVDFNEVWLALCLGDNDEIHYHLDQKREELIKVFNLKQKEAVKSQRLIHFLRFDIQEALEAIREIESLEDIKADTSSVLSLMTWLKVSDRLSLIKKHAGVETLAQAQEVLRLADKFEDSLSLVKVQDKDNPRLWEARALKMALIS